MVISSYHITLDFLIICNCQLPQYPWMGPIRPHRNVTARINELSRARSSACHDLNHTCLLLLSQSGFKNSRFFRRFLMFLRLLGLARTIYRHQWKEGSLTQLSHCSLQVRGAWRFSAKSLPSLDKTGIITRGQSHGHEINQCYYRTTWNDETVWLTVLPDWNSQLGYRYFLSLPFSCILGAKQATRCYPWWNKYSFWRIVSQNCCLFSDWLTQGSLTSFIFSRRRCLLTDFIIQFDRLIPRQPLDSGDWPEADGSSSTYFNIAKVLLLPEFAP